MAMRTIRTLGYGALAITAVACAKDERVAVVTAPPAVVAPATMTPRALALATTRGSAPIDVALAALRASAERQPDRVEPWILLGRAWVRKSREATDPGFYVNADACAEVALAIAPGDRLALDLRALVLLNDHRFEDARALAEKVVLQNAEDPMAYGNLSDALLELGRFDEAARAAQTMMDLKPNLPSYGRASYLRWLQGDTKGAKESARLAIDAGRDPRDPEPRAWMLVQAAMIFWHEGDYDGADARRCFTLRANQTVAKPYLR